MEFNVSTLCMIPLMLMPHKTATLLKLWPLRLEKKCWRPFPPLLHIRNNLWYLLPTVKEKQEWSLRKCLYYYLGFHKDYFPVMLHFNLVITPPFLINHCSHTAFLHNLGFISMYSPSTSAHAVLRAHPRPPQKKHMLFLMKPQCKLLNL